MIADLRTPARSKESDLILMGPFQVELFYDSMTAVLKPVDYPSKSGFVKEYAESSGNMYISTATVLL